MIFFSSRNIFMGLILLSLSACSKENYIYIQKQNPRIDQDFPVKEMKGSNAVDILWIIDNSGSMGSYQQQVKYNADAFMKDFIQQRLNWKMGLISTDEHELPYVGFTGSPQLDAAVSNPVDVFSNAVGRLGISGDPTEKTFTPILNALKYDPSFVRTSTPIAFISVTDAPEQSNISASNFSAQLNALVQGKNIFAYGVYATSDFKCTSSEGAWNYKGSPYEEFISSAFVGQVFSLCKDFGTSLVDIAHDIVTRVAHSAIYLSTRPNTETLQVLYKGKPLPSGPEEQGGYWVYDYRLNAVVFNNLDFAVNDTDSVKVVFEEQR